MDRWNAFGSTFEISHLDDARSGRLCFYDWLRERSGSLVGIRLILNDNAAAFVIGLPSTERLRQFGAGVLEVFFSKEDSYDPENSCQQEFAGLYLGQDEAGRKALLVTASDLSTADIGRFMDR